MGSIKITLQRVFVSREVVVGFALLTAFYSIARPELAIDTLYIGYGMLRPSMPLSPTGLAVVWGWWALYTYLLAVVIAGVYRGLRHFVGAMEQKGQNPS